MARLKDIKHVFFQEPQAPAAPRHGDDEEDHAGAGAEYLADQEHYQQARRHYGSHHAENHRPVNEVGFGLTDEFDGLAEIKFLRHVCRILSD